MSDLPKWVNWLARDKDDELYAYEVEPRKLDELWMWGVGGHYEPVEETGDTYAHIKWTDEEPTPVNHKFESRVLTTEEAVNLLDLLDLEPNPSVKETVNHPDHYQGNEYEAIDIIEDYNLNFHLGNVMKYVLRADKKNSRVEDLKKAAWYLNRELEREVK